jgi:hypothetical protein
MPRLILFSVGLEIFLKGISEHDYSTTSLPRCRECAPCLAQAPE